MHILLRLVLPPPSVFCVGSVICRCCYTFLVKLFSHSLNNIVNIIVHRFVQSNSSIQLQYFYWLVSIVKIVPEHRTDTKEQGNPRVTRKLVSLKSKFAAVGSRFSGYSSGEGDISKF